MLPNGRRILYVVGSREPDHETSTLRRLVEKAATQGFEPSLLIFHEKLKGSGQLIAADSDTPTWHALAAKAETAPFELAFANLLQEQAFDLVHFVSNRGSLALNLFERTYHQGVPVVYSPTAGAEVMSWRRSLLERTLNLAVLTTHESDPLAAVERYRDFIGSILPPDTHQRVTAVVATYNRSEILRQCLDGFTKQTLPNAQFEVIVVDDCSDEDPREIVESFADQLDIHYIRHTANQGLGETRNTGVAQASGDIVVFVDDDDRPAPRLLSEHLWTHVNYPGPVQAVLGFVGWDASLRISNFMQHVTLIGKQYLGFSSLSPFAPLPWYMAWGGATSFKTKIVREHPYVVPWLEDVDLGWRLHRLGLEVLYNPRAVQHVLIPATFEQFSRRMHKHGLHTVRLERLYPELANFINIPGPEVRTIVPDNLDAAIKIIKRYASRPRGELVRMKVTGESGSAEDQLDHAYKLVLEYHRLLGIQEAHRETFSPSA